jgi:hypothetical protein
MASLNLFKRRLASARGAELIEFALVLPLLLLLVLGIVDFGFLFQRLEVITNAAREGARIAVLAGSGYSTDDVKDRVVSYMEEGGVPADLPNDNPHIDVTGPTDLPIGTATPPVTVPVMQVSVTYTHHYLFLGGLAGFFGGSFSSVPLSAVSTMRIEGGGS